MNTNFPECTNIFVVNRIVENITGLNQAMLQRARLFYEHKGQETKILTLRFDPSHYINLEEELYSKKKINEGIQILNLYEFFKGQTNKELPRVVHPLDETTYNIEKNKNAYRLYKNGLYIKYMKYSDSNELVKVDYFNENRYCYKTEEFDNKGYLSRVVYNDYSNRKPRQELYYRPDGTCYLSKWFEWNDEQKKNKLLRIIRFNKNGETLKILHSEDELKHHFFDCVLEKSRSPIFMIAEARSIDKLVLNYTQENLYKIFVLHTMHLEDPNNVDSLFNSNHKVMLNSVDRMDGLVILTHKQRQDIENRVGQKDQITVIPHAFQSNSPEIPKAQSYDPKKIVMVARLNAQKSHDHAIKALAKAKHEVPDIKLVLVGDGENKENIKHLIEELGVEDNVEMVGFSHNPSIYYQEAAFSILTSDYEGFGLVLLESLVNGCPVVSYDLKYGPSDIIKDGMNGLLVENKNIEQLADKMIELLRDNNLLTKLRRNANVSMLTEFNEDTFVNNWSNLYNSILLKK
ncbi:glycosyltransferase [Alkalicoccobacillus gibsonii]|uniref:glycosyltransferase n=1 Tax=Alkalicoccobacillus gibsonii TaxID=79881 RepID=UPI001932F913|nr:glycosyltransferase [Alkalicoccobacillus gibsonii]MBM0066067.1 glycosyltransferase [Alkalicoccobacillus gibsonii]